LYSVTLIIVSNLCIVHCTCSQLRDAFVYQLTQGFSHFDRQLRNDLLVIISLISTTSVDIPYVQSGLAKHLALFATFQEGCFICVSFALFRQWLCDTEFTDTKFVHCHGTSLAWFPNLKLTQNVPKVTHIFKVQDALFYS